MSEKLKPCPRCGSRNIIHAPTARRNPKRPKWSTMCEDCRFSAGVAGTVADADQSWNKQVDDALDAELDAVVEMLGEGDGSASF